MMLKNFVRIAYIAFCAFLLVVYVRYFKWPNDWSWFQIDSLVFIALSLSSVSAFFIRGKKRHTALGVCSGSFAAIAIWGLSDMILRTAMPEDPYVASGPEVALSAALVLIPLAMLMTEIHTWRSRRAE